MQIQKGEKVYFVVDKNANWYLTCKIGELTMEYKISKKMCQNEEELKEYIKKEELF